MRRSTAMTYSDAQMLTYNTWTNTTSKNADPQAASDMANISSNMLNFGV